MWTDETRAAVGFVCGTLDDEEARPKQWVSTRERKYYARTCVCILLVFRVIIIIIALRL